MLVGVLYLKNVGLCMKTVCFGSILYWKGGIGITARMITRLAFVRVI